MLAGGRVREREGGQEAEAEAVAAEGSEREAHRVTQSTSKGAGGGPRTAGPEGWASSAGGRRLQAGVPGPGDRGRAEGAGQGATSCLRG